MLAAVSIVPDVPDECTGPTTGVTGVVNDLGSRIHLRGSRGAAYAGTFNSFNHSGGDIVLKLPDCPDGDNTGGSPLTLLRSLSRHESHTAIQHPIRLRGVGHSRHLGHRHN